MDAEKNTVLSLLGEMKWCAYTNSHVVVTINLHGVCGEMGGVRIRGNMARKSRLCGSLTIPAVSEAVDIIPVALQSLEEFAFLCIINLSTNL